MLFRDLPVGAVFVRCDDVSKVTGDGRILAYIKIAPFRPAGAELPSTFSGFNAYEAGDEFDVMSAIRGDRQVIPLSIDRTWINLAKASCLPRE